MQQGRKRLIHGSKVCSIILIYGCQNLLYTIDDYTVKVLAECGWLCWPECPAVRTR